MPILFLFGLSVVLAFISFATFRTGQLLQVWKPDVNLLLLPWENVGRVALIGICFGLGWISGRTPAELGWVSPDPLKDAGIGVALGLAIVLVLLFPELLVKRYRPQWHSDVVLQSIRPRSRRQWPLVMLALVLVALLEELIFRSLLLGGLAPYVNVLFFAIAASILFGLLHLPQGIWGVIAVIIVSLIFSGVFLWQLSLLLVVIAHWTVNVGQLALAQWLDVRETG
ncbi:MAG: CPBP family intramembrane metalloprotease [Caldilineales bacterium]|nr:CPBP family intramembrane metalloprotease [Caldilineales bacterium]